MALWKNSRYLSVTDTITAIDPRTYEIKQTLGIRLISSPNQSDNDVHLVQVGETIFDIAIKYYGDARLWWKIADANAVVLDDPYNLEGIVELLIPPN